MAAYKRCNFCHSLYQGERCKQCSLKHSKKRQSNNEALKLYGSGRWRKCRDNVRLKYLDYDIWMLGVGELLKIQGTVYVHHIYERDDRPDLLYDIDNLITVSASSHEQIHSAYITNRGEALKRIQRGIEAFKEMFGNDS